MGGSRGEIEMLLMRATYPFPPASANPKAKIPKALAGLLRCEYASLMLPSSPSFSGWRALLGGKTSSNPGDNHDGHDDERRGPACGAARGRVDQIERSGSAQGLHSRMRGTGEDRRQRLPRGSQNERRSGVGPLQRAGDG